MAQRPFSTLQGHIWLLPRQTIRYLDNSSTRTTIRKTDKQTTGFFLEMETRQKPISQQTSDTLAKRTNYED